MTAAGTVTVEYLGGLSHGAAEDSMTEVDAGVGTVRGLIKALRFEEHEVGTVLVNGKPALLETPIKAGDKVALFKPLG
jgi:molybdopterin converting factor small subunit